MRGKSVEDIFGSSPKEYAHELVKVMEKDRRETWKQIGFTVMNIVSFWIIASILIVNNGMLQISLIQCIGYSFSFILVVIGPNFLLRKMTFVTSFTKTWFSMWSLVMIAPMFLLGAVTILDVIYPTKMLTFTEVQSYIVSGGIFIITVTINIYFEGWFKNLYLIIPLSIMLVFKTFTTEDLMPMLFQIICLYGSLFILIFVEIMMKTNRREMVK